MHFRSQLNSKELNKIITSAAKSSESSDDEELTTCVKMEKKDEVAIPRKISKKPIIKPSIPQPDLLGGKKEEVGASKTSEVVVQFQFYLRLQWKMKLKV